MIPQIRLFKRYSFSHPKLQFEQLRFLPPRVLFSHFSPSSLFLLKFSTSHNNARNSVLSSTPSPNGSDKFKFVSTKLQNYGNRNDLEGMLSFFERMKAQNLVNKVSYSVVLNYLGKNNQIELMMKYYFELKKLNSNLDAPCFNSIFNCLGKNGLTKQLVSVYLDIKALNINVDDILQNSIIDSYRYQRKIDNVETYLKQFDMIPLPQNITFYNSLLFGLASKKNVKQALIYFEKMKTNPQLQPNEISYCAMIQLFGKLYEPVIMLKYYEEMKSKQLEPNKFTYSILFKYLGKCFRLNEIQKIMEEMKKTNIETNSWGYNALLRSCLRAKDWTTFYRYFSEIKNKKLCSLITYTIAIQAVGYIDHPGFLDIILDEINLLKIPYDNIFQECLICALIRLNRIREAQIRIRDPIIHWKIPFLEEIIRSFNFIRKSSAKLENYVSMLKNQNVFHLNPEQKMEFLVIFESLN